jgi:hypothetical protein
MLIGAISCEIIDPANRTFALQSGSDRLFFNLTEAEQLRDWLTRAIACIECAQLYGDGHDGPSRTAD